MDHQPSVLYRFLFWAILILAAIVRFKGLSTGLPFHTLYGENDTFQILLRILHTGDINPQSYIYPGLAYYIYLPFLYCFYWLGAVLGVFSNIQSVPDASFILTGRMISALLGTLSVYLVFRIGKYLSNWVALLSMAIVAAIPQHIEFSHMLRPEIPAIFFVLLAQLVLMALYSSPSRNLYSLFGIFAGAAFSTKYNIGLPLLFTLLIAHLLRGKQTRHRWLFLSLLAFAFSFAVANPFLLANPPSIYYWIQRVDSFYQTTEDYYGKNIAYYYLEFLTRYNYNLPLMFFALGGLILLFLRTTGKALLLLAYPLVVFLWLCSFPVRRIHGLLPLHPFLALYAALFLQEIWMVTRRFSRSLIFKLGYGLLLAVVLFWPYYKSSVQTYLFSRIDNRSRAELWITNRLPRGSRIALLEYHQIELDRSYFVIQPFAPKEYVGKKDFQWFIDQGFDYVVLSSGQYMRYFTEGPQAERYRNYFLKFFEDGMNKGTLVLDLITHPTLIPDYRIKVFSTRPLHTPPRFISAIEDQPGETGFPISEPRSVISLVPGYYLMEIPQQRDPDYSIRVTNLKLNEVILDKRYNGRLSTTSGDTIERYPFTIFPIRSHTRISLFSTQQPHPETSQLVQFRWKGIPPGIYLKRTQPGIRILNVEFVSSQRSDILLPYLFFSPHESFLLKCSLMNRGKEKIAGYLEAFLSGIGEPQPWKNYEVASEPQEFVLDPNQELTIAIPMNTGHLAGDHQLSFWVFTRNDVPFTPQNGQWLNKQIRVKEDRLGIHPIYDIPVP